MTMIENFYYRKNAKKKYVMKSKPFKWFKIAKPYSFLFTRKLGSIYFSKEYLFTRQKQFPGIFISWEIMTGEFMFPCE